MGRSTGAKGRQMTTDDLSAARAAVLPPIPWVYSDAPGILMWTWVTDHFVAAIRGAQASVDPALAGGADRIVRSYAWELCDLVRRQQDLPRLLIEGTCSSFDEAEGLVREHVGKAYDTRLGYGLFAGPLATTFTIADGRRVDVGDLVGQRCTVTVLVEGGAQASVAGDLSVHHYRWRLRDGDDVYEITPEHVVEVRHRSQAADRAATVVSNQTYLGFGRIYRDEWTRGCTGAPGFDQGTVDHVGAPRCPLHEVDVDPDSLR